MAVTGAVITGYLVIGAIIYGFGYRAGYDEAEEFLAPDEEDI